MSENKGKSNKVLVGVLCLLCVLILGLGVGIGILTNQPKKENTNSIYLDNQNIMKEVYSFSLVSF